MCAVRSSQYLLLTLSPIAVRMRLKYTFPLLQGLIPHVIGHILIWSIGLMSAVLDDSTLSLKVLLHRLCILDGRLGSFERFNLLVGWHLLLLWVAHHLHWALIIEGVGIRTLHVMNGHVCVRPWRAIDSRRHVHGRDSVDLCLILLLDALHGLLVLERHDDGATIAHNPLEDPRDV